MMDNERTRRWYLKIRSHFQCCISYQSIRKYNFMTLTHSWFIYPVKEGIERERCNRADGAIGGRAEPSKLSLLYLG